MRTHRPVRSPAGLLPALALLALPVPAAGVAAAFQESPPATVVAHRGASAYAPEHTLVAYELAIRQGTDFIEPDLQMTRDGRLVALHDPTLERTTDVATVFPDRYREEEIGGRTVRRWHVEDFTLDEIRRLDAGTWFAPAFAGARVPTLEEVVELALGRAGLYPETKAPERYAGSGRSMESVLVETLARYGLDRPGAEPATPVVIQSFSAESLRILDEELGSELPRTFLVGATGGRWTTDEALREVAGFASALGPSKGLLTRDPGLVARARAAGLSVVPYTYGAIRGGEPRDALAAEMTHAVCALGVDGLFTNNPDLAPRSCPDAPSGTLPSRTAAPGAAAEMAAAAMAEVEETVRRFYAALVGPELEPLEALVTPASEFVDGGRRMDRAGFLAFVAEIHAAAIPLDFLLEEMRTVVVGDVAYTTLRSTNQPLDAVFFETAILRRWEGRWRVDRFHSTPRR